MRIPPVTEFLIQAKILIPNIKTTDISDLPINNRQFPVIPEIDAQIDEWDPGRKKGRHFPTSNNKRPEKFAAEQHPRPHIIIKQPHLYAFSCFLRQQFNQFMAETVIPENIIYKMNTVFCIPDVFK